MALRFCDSFDHYLTADLTTKWTQSAGIAVTTAGRHGSGVAGTPSGTLTKILDYQATWTVGFAVKERGWTYVLGALDAGGGSISQILQLRANADNTVTLVTGASNVIGSTPAFDWSGGFHYVELTTTLSGTATITASCTARINSQSLISGSGSTSVTLASLTIGAAKANAHRITFNATTVDDVYITDGNGGVNTGFLGDVIIGVIRPNGDDTVNWNAFGSSTTTHYVDVNDTTPDSDTSYVYSTATGSMELFNWEDIAAFTGTIKGIQYSVYARKDDEGARVIQLVEGTTGTNTITNLVTGLADIYLNDNYDFHHVALDTSPTTGSAWTVSDFNADRFGFIIGTNT